MALAALDLVPALAAEQLVVALFAGDLVVAGAAIGAIVAVAGLDLVVAAATADHVVAVERDELVVLVGSDEPIRAVGADPAADADLLDQVLDVLPAERRVADGNEGVVEIAVEIVGAGKAILEAHDVDPVDGRRRRRSQARSRPPPGFRKLKPSRLPTEWNARIGSRLPSASVTTGAMPS